MAPIRIAVVGVGKIVRDQHLPALAESPDFELVAAASRNATVDGVANFKTIEAMLADGPALDAVALCMPPQVRFPAALASLRHGKHLLLEKPPGATVGEVAILKEVAAQHGCSLFASWHSRHAGAVEPARRLLQDREITSVQVTWKEDVRRWHPGQDWIWQPGGLGVFDPGINALSILTAILPRRLTVTTSKLSFPANRQAPIAAELSLTDDAGIAVEAALDWRQTGPQTWDIAIETRQGRVVLRDGGSRLTVGTEEGTAHPDREYPSLYAHFARLVRSASSDADASPLELVADAFLLGEGASVEPFEF